MYNKTAIVTGGSRGIGRAIAEELASIGYDLVVLSKNKAKLEETSKEIASKYKRKVTPFPCDLSDMKAIDKFEKFCMTNRVIPDVLVNNAGIWAPASTGESSSERYDEIMTTNTKGMFYLTQRLLPLLKKGSAKRIVIISSTWAQDLSLAEGKSESTVYAMSKWALRGWGHMLREEVRKEGISVTIVYPGAVFTDEWRGTKEPKEKFIKPEDIGKVVRAAVEIGPSSCIDEVIVNTRVGALSYD
ncbi:MAG: SDR family oxidoreductase [Candidatus Marsarchaeota archaeon]|jgi:3-oxoacyl-[acyl-carrier protein] reductase|nr:SDR family oxidoreductase [Candidatus Marsarchaeota archaeon]MCL5111965.1 SDR family oxidoreductase [Candidatus Marsarchaeota archaeon]